MPSGYRIGEARQKVWARGGGKRTLVEFAGAMRLFEGPKEGEMYDPRSEPAQYEILRALDDVRFIEVKVLKPVQAGGTLAGQIWPAMWCLFDLREAVVFGGPDMTVLGRLWSQKLKRAIEKNGFGDLLPSSGKGSRGGAPDEIHLDGVPLTFMGAGAKNEAAQASITARAVFTDEYDSIEAYRRRLIKGRARSYGQKAMMADCTTLKEALGDSLMLSEYETVSTGSRLALRCPHSGFYFIIEWEHVVYDDASEIRVRKSAHIELEHPLTGDVIKWTERDRRAALRDWLVVHKGQHVIHCVDEGVVVSARVVGDAPETTVFGLRWWSGECSMRDLGDVAAIHWKAQQLLDEQGDESAMANFTRDELVKPYISDRAEEDGLVPRMVAKRTINYGRGEIPDDALAVTIGIDPGGRRTGIHAVGLAVRPNRRCHVFMYDRFAPYATDGQRLLQALHAYYTDIILPGWGGRTADMIFVDSQWQTAYVDEFCRSVGFNRCKPIQGYSQTNPVMRHYRPKTKDKHKTVLRHDKERSQPAWFEERTQKRGRLLQIDGDFFKQRVHLGLRQPITHAGAITLFQAEEVEHLESPDITDARHVPGYAVQVCAERQEWSERMGCYVWSTAKEISAENHYLDGSYMAYCAADYLGALRTARPTFGFRSSGGVGSRKSAGMVTPDGRAYSISER